MKKLTLFSLLVFVLNYGCNRKQETEKASSSLENTAIVSLDVFLQDFPTIDYPVFIGESSYKNMLKEKETVKDSLAFQAYLLGAEKEACSFSHCNYHVIGKFNTAYNQTVVLYAYSSSYSYQKGEQDDNVRVVMVVMNNRGEILDRTEIGEYYLQKNEEVLLVSVAVTVNQEGVFSLPEHKQYPYAGGEDRHYEKIYYQVDEGGMINSKVVGDEKSEEEEVTYLLPDEFISDLKVLDTPLELTIEKYKDQDVATVVTDEGIASFFGAGFEEALNSESDEDTYGKFNFPDFEASTIYVVGQLPSAKEVKPLLIFIDYPGAPFIGLFLYKNAKVVGVLPLAIEEGGSGAGYRLTSSIKSKADGGFKINTKMEASYFDSNSDFNKKEKAVEREYLLDLHASEILKRIK